MNKIGDLVASPKSLKTWVNIIKYISADLEFI